VTTVVLTHCRPDDRPEDDENFVFVTGGIERRLRGRGELAGSRDVIVNGGDMGIEPTSWTSCTWTSRLATDASFEVVDFHPVDIGQEYWFQSLTLRR
jgi:hypothetical protein